MTTQVRRTDKERYGFLSITELESRGVPVLKVDATLTNMEKETSISFSQETDSKAEIAAFAPIWMRRIEGMGVIPREVHVYANAQCRFYEIPKSRLKPPIGKRPRTAKQKEAAKNNMAKLQASRLMQA